MKKRGIGFTDIFMILVIVACVVGIVVRAFGITDAKTERYYEYRVSFSARLDEKQLEKLAVGTELTDKNGAEYKLLEGYWITREENAVIFNGDLLTSGRLTEKGFESDGGYYYKNDAVSLRGAGIEFDASITGFTKQ